MITTKSAMGPKKRPPKRHRSRTILIVASEENLGVEDVVRRIESEGGRCFRFDPMRFPASWPIAVAAGEAPVESFMGRGKKRLDLKEISAVWFRSERVGALLPKSLDATTRAICIDASTTVLEGTLSPLRTLLLDCPRFVRAASSKAHQLGIARRFGLQIPRTLISNDPTAVRRFAKSCRSGLITKMPVSAQVSMGEGAGRQVVYTRRIQPDVLADLRGLELCPMIFQERLEKGLELRVTVVGREIFAASVDSSVSHGAAIDWRRDQMSIAHTWKPHGLPKSVARNLLRLLDALRLNYGGVDFILAEDGRYVFLEVNPLGAFKWIEHYTELPISTAISELLMGRSKLRVLPD